MDVVIFVTVQVEHVNVPYILTEKSVTHVLMGGTEHIAIIAVYRPVKHATPLRLSVHHVQLVTFYKEPLVICANLDVLNVLLTMSAHCVWTGITVLVVTGSLVLADVGISVTEGLVPVAVKMDLMVRSVIDVLLILMERIVTDVLTIIMAHHVIRYVPQIVRTMNATGTMVHAAEAVLETLPGTHVTTA